MPSGSSTKSKWSWKINVLNWFKTLSQPRSEMKDTKENFQNCFTKWQEWQGKYIWMKGVFWVGLEAMCLLLYFFLNLNIHYIILSCFTLVSKHFHFPKLISITFDLSISCNFPLQNHSKMLCILKSKFYHLKLYPFANINSTHENHLIFLSDLFFRMTAFKLASMAISENPANDLQWLAWLLF